MSHESNDAEKNPALMKVRGGHFGMSQCLLVVYHLKKRMKIILEVNQTKILTLYRRCNRPRPLRLKATGVESERKINKKISFITISHQVPASCYEKSRIFPQWCGRCNYGPNKCFSTLIILNKGTKVKPWRFHYRVFVH